jgi:hypothetical protein
MWRDSVRHSATRATRGGLLSNGVRRRIHVRMPFQSLLWGVALAMSVTAGAAAQDDVVARAMQRSLLTHNALPLLDSLLRNVPPADAQAKAVHWTEHGMTRLRAVRLVDRVRLERQIFDRIDTVNCAGALTGVANPAALSAVVASLDSAAIQQWVDLAVDALLADARRRPAPAVLTLTDVQHLHDGTAAALAPDEAARYRRIITPHAFPEGLGASCWAVRQIVGHILTEDPASQARDARTWILMRAGVRPVAG